MESNGGTLKIISVILGILDILSSLITIIPFIYAINSKQFIAYLIVVSLLVISVCLFSFRKKISMNILKKIMNLTCPYKMYKLKKKESIYEYETREQMRHEKIFEVQVLHDGFDGVNDKFKWTGDDHLMPCPKYDTQEIEPLGIQSGMQLYKIKFKNNRRYNKSDKVEPLGMVIENITDPEQKSSTHLSSGVFEVTDQLVLHLIFGANLKPKNIRKLEYLHYSDDCHFHCERGEATYNEETGKREIIWTIDKPFFGGKYMIDWDF